MRRKSGGSVVFGLLVLMMLALPVWQLVDWAETKEAKSDAVVLLHQVSAFQMELAGSAMNEAGSIKNAGQLNEWKRSAYAAQFAHERLAEAVGKEKLPKLEALDALLQWIMRVQIGGERPLRQEEQEVLRESAKRFKPISEAYGKLIGSDGEVISSVSGKLEQGDRDLSAYLRGKTK